jgi:lysozyme
VALPKPSYALVLARLKVERGRERYRYSRWATFQSKRPQTPGVYRERVKWWAAYTAAHHKRLALEHEAKEKAPKFVPGVEVSTRGVSLIKSFEGYAGSVYHDAVGVPTVGYGHTENVPGNGRWLPHQRESYHLTEPEAAELLRRDLNANYAPYVRALRVKLTQNQFDALTSFVYNVGPGGLQGTIGADLHAGQYRAAANALLAWDHAGGQVLLGLQRRREAERHLFLS